MLMTKKIGLLGAHRVGKSSLVHGVHGSMGDELIGVASRYISIGTWQQEIGYDSSCQEYPWETRKAIQIELLARFRHTLYSAMYTQQRLPIKSTWLIYDRTPLDLIGYTLWSFPKDPTEADNQWMREYITACIQLTNKYFSSVILVQPGIPLVPVGKSAACDPEMIDMFNTYYLGVLANTALKIERHIMPSEMTNVQERVAFVKNVIRNLQD